mmetsp:Transcript_57553/g.93129  ORF Transcript_57553/g.93129 Transcript_57553/m.93129 type:complete len:121 (+) Transcript_57553:459-821(+)
MAARALQTSDQGHAAMVVLRMVAVNMASAFVKKDILEANARKNPVPIPDVSRTTETTSTSVCIAVQTGYAMSTALVLVTLAGRARIVAFCTVLGAVRDTALANSAVPASVILHSEDLTVS